MITQPESNIKLTDKHLAQIEEGENRLSNLESLITIANRNLKVVKLELERTTKDILLQTEKLTALTLQVETKSKELNSITASYSETLAKLSTLNSEIENKTAQYSLKSIQLDDRETKIAQKEKQLSEQGEKLGRETILFNNDKATHNAKVAKLKEVISTF